MSKSSLEVLVADVRELDWDTLGTFDVMVCSGLLYHLTLPDAVDARAPGSGLPARGSLLVDTEVAWGPARRGLSRRLRTRATASASTRRRCPRSATRRASGSRAPRSTRCSTTRASRRASSWARRASRAASTRATVAALVGERVERLELEPEPCAAGRAPGGAGAEPAAAGAARAGASAAPLGSRRAVRGGPHARSRARARALRWRRWQIRAPARWWSWTTARRTARRS